MRRTTLLLAAPLIAAALLAGCAGPPDNESTHTSEPEGAAPSEDTGQCPYDGVESDDRVAGDPIGDVADREGGPSRGDGDETPTDC